MTIDAVTAALQDARAAVLARLIRVVGSYAAAEDVLQDAMERALTQWRSAGVPDHPRAWLYTTARNRYIDTLRRQHSERDHLQTLQDSVPDGAADSSERCREADFADDLLRLLFTCCHPALRHDQQVLLTLKLVLGMNHAELARALLTTRATLDQRLVRAKRALAAAGVAYEVPSTEALPARLNAVLKTVYLMFNQGYAACEEHEQLIRRLCDEAIRLGRQLQHMFPGHAEVQGLLALMLLHAARLPARDVAGCYVPLAEQERSRWDRARVREGEALLEQALRRHQLGPYQLQAAISALHCSAASFADTDWEQIVLLYDELVELDADPVAQLNRAVALCYAGDPEAALAQLAEVRSWQPIDAYAPYHAARAEILIELQRTAEAGQALTRALQLTVNRAERNWLAARKLSVCGSA